MKVQELINQLKQFDPNAIIELEILDRSGNGIGTTENATFEIYETVNNSICIQAIDY